MSRLVSAETTELGNRRKADVRDTSGERLRDPTRVGGWELTLVRNSTPAHCGNYLQPRSVLHSSHLCSTQPLNGRNSQFIDEETDAVVKRQNIWKNGPRI